MWELGLGPVDGVGGDVEAHLAVRAFDSCDGELGHNAKRDDAARIALANAKVDDFLRLEEVVRGEEPRVGEGVMSRWRVERSVEGDAEDEVGRRGVFEVG